MTSCHDLRWAMNQLVIARDWAPAPSDDDVSAARPRSPLQLCSRPPVRSARRRRLICAPAAGKPPPQHQRCHADLGPMRPACAEATTCRLHFPLPLAGRVGVGVQSAALARAGHTHSAEMRVAWLSPPAGGGQNSAISKPILRPRGRRAPPRLRSSRISTILATGVLLQRSPGCAARDRDYIPSGSMISLVIAAPLFASAAVMAYRRVP